MHIVENVMVLYFSSKRTFAVLSLHNQSIVGDYGVNVQVTYVRLQSVWKVMLV